MLHLVSDSACSCLMQTDEESLLDYLPDELPEEAHQYPDDETDIYLDKVGCWICPMYHNRTT